MERGEGEHWSGKTKKGGIFCYKQAFYFHSIYIVDTRERDFISPLWTIFYCLYSPVFCNTSIKHWKRNYRNVKNLAVANSCKESIFHKNLYLYFFKACVCYFFSIFYLSPNDSPLKNMKNVFYFI